MLYRKKPVVVDAFQLTEETRRDNRDWPEWANYAWNFSKDEVGALYPADFPDSDGTDDLMVNTLEGPIRVSIDDFIIKGVKGELYPCKPDIFHMTYEPAE